MASAQAPYRHGQTVELITAIRKFFYADVSAILLLIIACVVVIDLVSERIRHRLLALESR